MSNKLDQMKEINLTLTIDEVNQILEALGAQPFNRVFLLISKIQSAAAAQLNGQPEEMKQQNIEEAK
jgi:hypothetical protein